MNSIFYKEFYGNTISWFSLAVFNVENSSSSQTDPNFAQILRTWEYCQILSMSGEVVDSLGCVSCHIPILSVSWDQGLWLPTRGEGICLLRLPAWWPIKGGKIRPNEPLFLPCVYNFSFWRTNGDSWGWVSEVCHRFPSCSNLNKRMGASGSPVLKKSAFPPKLTYCTLLPHIQFHDPWFHLHAVITTIWKY